MREGAQHPICAAGAHCMTGVQQCLDERVLYLVWLDIFAFMKHQTREYSTHSSLYGSQETTKNVTSDE